jgi:hypothetical protein
VSPLFLEFLRNPFSSNLFAIFDECMVLYFLKLTAPLASIPVPVLATVGPPVVVEPLVVGGNGFLDE